MKVIVRTGRLFRGAEILLEVEVSDSAYAGRIDDTKKMFRHFLDDVVKDYVAPWWETKDESK